jgi:Uma2 family endonuclease
MGIHEIVLPETKPETVSPQRTHALLQLAFASRLDRWAAGRGNTGTEWRFRIAPAGEVRRPLVPDVAYVSNERLRPLNDEEVETPPLAPDVATEILSPGDRRADLEDKIGVYLRAGSSLVIVVDPQRRAVELHDPNATTILTENDVIAHDALPAFAYPVSDLFSVLRRL